MMIHVQWRKHHRRYHHDYIDTSTLEELIKKEEVGWFYRPSEQRWVNIYRGPVRGLGGVYSGTERRQPSMTL
jgi:hypothetical protein